MQPQGQTTEQAAPITTDEEFNKKYWFSPEQLIVVRNPLTYNYNFAVEMRRYQVPANGQQQMTGFIANVFLDQVSRVVAQNQGQFEHMIDPALRAQIYDSLIVSVNDVMPQYIEEKAYLKPQNTAPQSQPFAQLNVAQSQPEPQNEVVKQEQAPKQEDVAFEYDGAKYELKHTDGQPVYTVNGQPTTDNEFYRAASLI